MKKEIAAEVWGNGLAEWLEKEVAVKKGAGGKKRALTAAEKFVRWRRLQTLRKTNLGDFGEWMGIVGLEGCVQELEEVVLGGGDAGKAVEILANADYSLCEVMDAGLYASRVFHPEFVMRLTGKQAEELERVLLKGGEERDVAAWMARKRALARAMRSGGGEEEPRNGGKASEGEDFDLRMGRARNCAEYLEVLEDGRVGKKELTKSAWTERIYQRDIFEGASEALKGRMAKWLWAVWRPVQLRFRAQMAESEGLGREWAKVLFDPDALRKLSAGTATTEAAERLTWMTVCCEAVRNMCRETEWVRAMAGGENGVEGNYLRYSFSWWLEVAKRHFISYQGPYTQQVKKAIEEDNVAGFEMVRDLYGLSFTKANLRYIARCGAREIMRHQIEAEWKRLEKIMGAKELAFYLCANAWWDYGFAEEMVKALDGRFPGLFLGLRDCNGESPLDYVRYSEDSEWKKAWANWRPSLEEKKKRVAERREARKSLERTLIGLGCDPDHAPKGGLSWSERILKNR